MRAHLFVGLAAALALASGPALATGANTGSAKTTAAKADAKGEKKVCKKIERSGTRFAEKVCLTKAEWARIEAQD